MVEKSLSKAGAKLARKFVKKLQAAKVSLPHENQPEE
jgi:hypothetical protein